VTDYITRADARTFGLRRFYTGEPCQWGHDCERYVSNDQCVECSRDPMNQCSARELKKRHDYAEDMRKMGATERPVVTHVTVRIEVLEGNGV
jgi:hypothetical protein